MCFVPEAVTAAVVLQKDAREGERAYRVKLRIKLELYFKYLGTSSLFVSFLIHAGQAKWPKQSFCWKVATLLGTEHDRLEWILRSALSKGNRWPPVIPAVLGILGLRAWLVPLQKQNYTAAYLRAAHTEGSYASEVFYIRSFYGHTAPESLSTSAPGSRSRVSVVCTWQKYRQQWMLLLPRLPANDSSSSAVRKDCRAGAGTIMLPWIASERDASVRRSGNKLL